MILETLVLKYELKGKARTRPDIFRVVLDPWAKFYPLRPRSKNGAKHQKSKPKQI